MVFIDNKYTRVYNKIITQAKSRVNDCYTEKHHIIPKSLGGTNDIDNIVVLTAKEHYICHLLLIKMTEGKNRTKMRYAAYRFTHINPYQKGRLKITGRRYQYLKEQMFLANKERVGPNKGKKMSEEQKVKISNALKGKKLGPQSPEHRAKLGQYTRTEEHRKFISDMRKNQTGKQTRSIETKSKMSAWQKGIPKPKVTCEHCGKEASLMNYKRWHSDNCKYR